MGNPSVPPLDALTGPADWTRRQFVRGVGGADHWIPCQSVLFAGGDSRGGQIYGASDKVAAYPADRPVHPEQLAATVYHGLGIPMDLSVKDREGPPLRLLDEDNPLPFFE